MATNQHPQYCEHCKKTTIHYSQADNTAFYIIAILIALVMCFPIGLIMLFFPPRHTWVCGNCNSVYGMKGVIQVFEGTAKPSRWFVSLIALASIIGVGVVVYVASQSKPNHIGVPTDIKDREITVEQYEEESEPGLINHGVFDLDATFDKENKAHIETEAKRKEQREAQAKQREELEKERWRTWKSGNFKTYARFSHAIGDIIYLDKENGERIKVQRNKLCVEDQEWLESLKERLMPK